jgi:threonine dehydratase
MSSNSAVTKLESAKGYGAKVFLSGCRPEDREAMAIEIQKRTGAVLIPPSDHPNIVLGQGTAILELIQQVEELGEGKLDAVIMPSGGGGLLAGAAVVCKGSAVKVFGSEPQRGGADLARGIKEGKRIEVVNSSTIADGLRVPVGRSNWELLSRTVYVEKVYTVTEQQIRDAMRLVIEKMKMIIEPSAAVPLAAILYNEEFRLRIARDGTLRKIGVVLTGGNTTVSTISDIFNETRTVP